VVRIPPSPPIHTSAITARSVYLLERAFLSKPYRDCGRTTKRRLSAAAMPYRVPIPESRSRARGQRFSGFLNVQSAKVPEFDDAALALVDPGKFVGRIAERDHVDVWSFAHQQLGHLMLSLPGRLAERIMRPGVETTLWVLNARSRRRSRSCPESGRSGD